ncbi:MAG: hypothetical protein WCO78_01520 [Candidatus Roizmanbacteria bacterium]
MAELLPYSLPCRMSPNQASRVAQLREQVPGFEMVAGPIKGAESVPVIIEVPREAPMFAVFGLIYKALNSPLPGQYCDGKAMLGCKE